MKIGVWRFLEHNSGSIEKSFLLAGVAEEYQEHKSDFQRQHCCITFVEREALNTSGTNRLVRSFLSRLRSI